MNNDNSASPNVQSALESLRAVLSSLGVGERFEVLGELFRDLPDDHKNAQGPPSAADPLKKKVISLQEELATVRDQLAAAKADLQLQQTRSDAEQTRAAELQRIGDEQRGRLDQFKKRVDELETSLEAQTAAVHKLQKQNDDLLLKLQRAEATGDRRGVQESLENTNLELSAEIKRLETDLAQVRADRDRELDALKSELAEAKNQGGEDAILTRFWDKLRAADPALCESDAPADAKAADRLVGTLIDFIHAAHEFDQTMAVFLSKYTKHNPSIKVPWDVYRRRDDIVQTARQVLSPRGGKPVGLLKLRLRFLYRWTESAMIAADSVIESLASELHEQLIGDAGMGSDPNRRIRDFVRDDGHELYLQHMRELLSDKLAETYGRGG